jgi:hypothetical protein
VGDVVRLSDATKRRARDRRLRQISACLALMRTAAEAYKQSDFVN